MGKVGDKIMCKRPSIAAFGLTAMLALGAAGCSGAGDDGTLPTLEPLDDASNVEEATTTTTESTTSTTAATTTSSVVEDTIRPELDPANWETDLDEIFGRYLLYLEAIDTAYGPPSVDANYAPLADLAGSEAMADITADIETYQSAGHVLVVADDSMESNDLRLPRPTSLDKIEGNEVVIQDCWIADRTKETVGGEVVETWSFPTVFNVTMKVIDGEWRVFASVVAADESDGWDECNDKFANLGN